MCDVKNCFRPSAVMIEGGHMICSHHDRLMKKYVCKHCGVEMVSRDNHHPILGKEHKKSCPRRRMLG